MILELKVKYHVEGLEPITKIEKGDWIDLRSAYDYELKQGQFEYIDLGVSIKIPKGFEMNIVPRSSTFKNWGIIQTNHFGIVDESYSGNEDIIKMPVYATRDTKIKKNDRVCQFRLNEKMPPIIIKVVQNMEDESRGGFGSTGVN
jgi:dUTP pyrophosphatase